MNNGRVHSRGVALIEALVALAVMAFGMLGVAAMQSSLRQNADLARQRAEAVRLAEASIEQLRAYSVIETVAGRTAYNDAVASPAPAENIAGANATYTRTVTITPEAAQNRKTIDVLVIWSDRATNQHQVRLSSIIHRTPPELAGSLIIPGCCTAGQLVGGTNSTILDGAVPDPDNPGQSIFTPPQPSSPNPVRWVFNNTTGMITQRCQTSCSAAIYGRLLAGYIAFSTGNSQPTAAQAESPSSNAQPGVGIEIADQALPNPLAFPGSPGPWECFVESLPASPATPKTRAYYCMIQVLSADNFLWSAQSRVTGLSLASSINDDHDNRFRVCRYTPYRNNNGVGTGSPALTNEDHPFRYLLVSSNLVNQNFLVIRAGDDDDAFNCPADFVPSAGQLNLVNGNTWHHQPSS